MNTVAQLELLQGGKPLRAEQPVSDEVVYRQPDKLGAIKLAQHVSGLDDKAIYMPMGIDKATWSRIQSGQANFPTNGDVQFMKIVGNLIPLQWEAYQFGKGLIDLEDSKDRQIRELMQTVEEQRREIETLVKYGVIQRAK